jgi:glycerol-3-phosphate O-acyltransferase/dihydroxyacetone phosphate acyltransferase
MAGKGKDKGKKPLAVMNKYVYDAFLWTFSILVELFFREVHPRSSWKVPKEGPVIFVCAPHANQVGRLTSSRFLVYKTDATSLSTLSC